MHDLDKQPLVKTEEKKFQKDVSEGENSMGQKVNLIYSGGGCMRVRY